MRQDVTRTTLAVLFIGGLILACLWVLRPFLPAIAWAMTLVVATWPLLLRVQDRVGGRRGVAVLVMTLMLLVALIVPFWVAAAAVLTHIGQLTDLVRNILSLQVPPPPAWLAALPVVGGEAAAAWGQFSASGVRELGPLLTPYAALATRWFAAAAGSVGGMVVHFLLTLIVAAILYARGEAGAAVVLRFGRALGGAEGERAVRIAGGAIRSVALGVVVTAVVQSALGGVGLAVAGVPFAGLLTGLMFMLCLAQIGPGPVLIPAVAWYYYAGNPLWATLLLAVTVFVIGLESVLRPFLIRRGADLPLLLILAGVIGGLISFGLLGIFIGPTVLAVTYRLVEAWMGSTEMRLPAEGPAGPPAR